MSVLSSSVPALSASLSGGGGIDQRPRLVSFVFQQDGTGDGFVGNRLAGDFDGVLGDRGLFFGSRRGGLGGLFFLDSLGFFFLGAFLCAGWQDEKRRESERAEVKAIHHRCCSRKARLGFGRMILYVAREASQSGRSEVSGFRRLKRASSSPITPRNTAIMKVWQPCWCGSSTTRQRGSETIRVPSRIISVASDVQIAQRSPRRMGMSASIIPIMLSEQASATGHGPAYSASVAAPSCRCALAYAGAASDVYSSAAYAATTSPTPSFLIMARPSLLSHQVNHRSVKRRLMEPSPFAEARRSEARLLAIQSAPDSMSSLSGAVVRRAKTRAPAALPARMPAGEIGRAHV